MADLIVGTGIREVTLRSGARRVTLRRSAAAPEPERQHLDAPSRAEVTDVIVHDPEPAHSPVLRACASLVGVFHHLEPPVRKGDAVSVGQVIGAIESMKLMSDVRCEAAGVVDDVLVDDGAAVEYGQPLFLFRGSGTD